MTSRRDVFTGETIRLHHGGCIAGCRVAYQLCGKPGEPVVLVMGGITAGRNVADGQGGGWWEPMVGPGRALDPARTQILGVDFLGGAGASSPVPAGRSLDTKDQATAIRELCRGLKVTRLHAVIGSSYGGMIALALARMFRDLVERLVIISAAHRPHPLSTALRCAQRRIVQQAHGAGAVTNAMVLARAIAMTTYRTEREFDARFASTPYRAGDRYRFPVEDYLDHVGMRFALGQTPRAFHVLSESIDLHHVDAGAIRTPATLVAVEDDRVVPLALMQELRERIGGPVTWHQFSSRFGHDAFLKEPTIINAVLQAALGANYG